MTVREELQSVPSTFPTVSSASTALHLTQDHDPKVVLQPRPKTVSVRPYRYNHMQKDEMERLVAEMLASGIIQPSASP